MNMHNDFHLNEMEVAALLRKIVTENTNESTIGSITFRYSVREGEIYIKHNPSGFRFTMDSYDFPQFLLVICPEMFVFTSFENFQERGTNWYLSFTPFMHHRCEILQNTFALMKWEFPDGTVAYPDSMTGFFVRVDLQKKSVRKCWAIGSILTE